MMKQVRVLCCVFATATSACWAGVATFDGKDTGPNGYYRPGSPGGIYDWTDGGMTFRLRESDDGFGGTVWGGFTYSSVNDPSTPGFGNQFAVYTPGTDVSGSGVYGVGYVDSFSSVLPGITLPGNDTVQGLYVNNTTYAALSMLNGDAFAKQFGGISGNDPDWFLLTVTGRDAGGAATGNVDFYLADYRFADNGQDYIVDSWTWVDLSSLGPVAELEFSLSSSDVGVWGMNTPAYFAIDQVTIPEPSTCLALVVGALAAIRRRR